MTTTTYRQLETQHRHLQEGHAVLTHTLIDTELDDTGQEMTLGGLLDAAPTALGVPCQEHPADLWFAELPGEVEHAKELCGPCPIREECLRGALQRGEPWGVWGGQLVLGGVVVPRKRPRGRPRKDEVAA